MADVFTIDHEHDKDGASDGVSRYGSYVRSGSFEPWTDDDRHVELAIYAWERGTSPVMTPSYIRFHPRVRHVTLQRSDWDGSLLASVGLVIPQPAQFRNALPGPSVSGWWREWPSESSFLDGKRWYEPDGQELSGSAYLLCTASLRFAVPSGDLPQPYPEGADTERCKLAIGVLVHELNLIVGPVIDRIEGN